MAARGTEKDAAISPRVAPACAASGLADGRRHLLRGGDAANMLDERGESMDAAYIQQALQFNGASCLDDPAPPATSAMSMRGDRVRPGSPAETSVLFDSRPGSPTETHMEDGGGGHMRRGASPPGNIYEERGASPETAVQLQSRRAYPTTPGTPFSLLSGGSPPRFSESGHGSDTRRDQRRKGERTSACR